MYGNEYNVGSGRSSGSSLETHRGTCVNKYALRRRSQTSSAVDGRPCTHEYIGLFRYYFYEKQRNTEGHALGKYNNDKQHFYTLKNN